MPAGSVPHGDELGPADPLAIEFRIPEFRRGAVDADVSIRNPNDTVERGNLVPARYEIRIAGRLDETAAAAFAGLDVTTRGGITVVRGEFDQASLHGLLEWIRFLSLDLVDARRVRAAPGTRPHRRAASPQAGDPRMPC